VRERGVDLGDQPEGLERRAARPRVLPVAAEREIGAGGRDGEDVGLARRPREAGEHLRQHLGRERIRRRRALQHEAGDAVRDRELDHRFVPCQPFLEMSKITPSGSLNLRSKFSFSASLPRSKKNLPPSASILFCVSARSSTWKPKWCAPM